MSYYLLSHRSSQYIYEKFYSEEAKFRNAPKRIELARLTNRQYKESVSDLFQDLFEIEEEIRVLPKFDPDISMRVRTSHQSAPWI